MLIGITRRMPACTAAELHEASIVCSEPVTTALS
jgi:hypothetical protein